MTETNDKSTTRRIDGIFFDLGETILNFGPVDVPELFRAGARSAYSHLRSLGQPLPSFTMYHLRQLWAIRIRYFLSKLTHREFNCLDLVIRLGRRMGQNLTRQQYLDLCWLWYEPLSRVASREETAVETLQHFRQAGLKLGLVSNTFIPGQVLDRHLRQEGLLDLFDVRMYSSDFGWRKPHTRIFEAALQQAQLQASRTLFVGDSPTSDIKGANLAGMISVLKDPDDHYLPSRVPARHRIRRLAELVDIVAEYNTDAQPGLANAEQRASSSQQGG